MTKIKVESDQSLPAAIIEQVLSLATSGFGLVAALAWNEVVKEAVESHIKPYLPQGSTLISLLLYAIIVTSLAVIVTLQLTRLKQAILEEKNKKKK